MPVKYEMRWEERPYYRWVKMYHRTRYRVSCADLGLPKSDWTKEASFRKANEWWLKTKAEIDLAAGRDERRPEPLEDVLAATGILDPDILKDPWKMGQYIFAASDEEAEEGTRGG